MRNGGTFCDLVARVLGVLEFRAGSRTLRVCGRLEEIHDEKVIARMMKRVKEEVSAAVVVEA